MNDDTRSARAGIPNRPLREENQRRHGHWKQWAAPWTEDGTDTRRRERVVVIGAGITGLTAAQELVERGFSVVVVERHGEPAVGGVARSQWVKLPDDAVLACDGELELPEATKWTGEHYRVVAAALRNQATLKLSPTLGNELISRFASASLASNDLVADQVNLESAHNKMSINLKNPKFSEAFFEFLGSNQIDVKVSVSEEGATGLSSVLKSALSPFVRASTAQATAAWRGAPGEHGFRFFPSFYRNLFDTLRRIPVYLDQAADKNADKTEVRRSADPIRTVFDNLVPMNNVLVALGDGEPPLRLLRHAPQSLEELWNMADDTFRRLGFDAQDSVRYQVEMFRWMTACPGRRAEWAGDFPADHWPAIDPRPSTDDQKAVGGTWWDHIDATSRFSRGFKEQIRASSMALVGMKAREIDARTYGNVAVQMLLDQVGFANRADFTLNGPTSEAWFDPWKDYLEDLGVVFLKGELKSIERADERWNPVWTKDVASDNPQIQEALKGGADYFVLAVALPQVFDLLEASEPPWALPTTLKEIGRWKCVATAAQKKSADSCEDEFDEPHVESPVPQWYEPKRLAGPMPFRNMSGVQYFFRTHLHIERGHYYLPRSDWSLSALSQGPQWRKQNDKTVRGVLSVDISNFEKPDARTNRAAWQVGREELVITTWAQIMRARGSWDGPLQLPRYDHAHVDKYLEYDKEGKKLLANKAPYLINLPGQWKLRAPVNDPPEDRTAATEKLRYRVESGWVVAGPHMKTHTRLATMEAANESAKHAVNAILRDAREDVDEADTYVSDSDGNAPGRRYALCPIANLEEHEVPDLNVFKDVDARLYERGLPHMFDILEVRELVDGALGSKGPAAAFGAMEDAVLDRLGLTRVRAGSAARPMQAVLDLVRQGLSKLVK
jgi:hypothetical protein